MLQSIAAARPLCGLALALAAEHRYVVRITGLSMRIVDVESPLNRLPAELHPTQRGWLEGVRYSVEIIDIAMRRLRDNLVQATKLIASDRIETQTSSELDIHAAALADAWTFVDATWRLKRFLIDGRIPRQPGAPDPERDASAPVLALKPLRDGLLGVKALRDGYQHLDNQAARLTANGLTVWGYLNWVAEDLDAKSLHTCALVSGMVGAGESDFQLVNPAGMPFERPIDHITLRAFGSESNLSALYRCVVGTIRSLEDAIRPQFIGRPHGAAGIFVSVKVRPEAP